MKETSTNNQGLIKGLIKELFLLIAVVIAIAGTSIPVAMLYQSAESEKAAQVESTSLAEREFLPESKLVTFDRQ